MSEAQRARRQRLADSLQHDGDGRRDLSSGELSSRDQSLLAEAEAADHAELLMLQAAYQRRLDATRVGLESAGAEVVYPLEAVAVGFLVHTDREGARRIEALREVASVRPAPVIALSAAPEETGGAAQASGAAAGGSGAPAPGRDEARALSRAAAQGGDEATEFSGAAAHRHGAEPDRSVIVPQVGASRVGQELNLKGDDMLVAVLSTGVDYTHVDFLGSGDVQEYQRNNENQVESGTFPTRKVVGGYDLAGRRYSPHPSCIEPNPASQECTKTARPDDDPLDTRGEGTLSAGVIAGVGFGDVGPGVAPQARLVSLKVFGNPVDAPVMTDLMHPAFDWVFKNNLRLDLPGWPTDRIQVIDMGLASGWLGGSYETRQLVREANAAGITVVVAAGNDGDTPYFLDALASSDEALTVGAVWPNGQHGLLYEASWQGESGPESATGLAYDSIIAGQPKTRDSRIEGDLAWMGNACNDNPPVQPVSGKVALVERGECGFAEKFTNAAAAGATGVVVFTIPEQPKSEMGGDSAASIPAAMIDRAPGVAMREALEAGRSASILVHEPSGVDVLGNTVAAFSSRGPSRFDPGLKPQLMAPGIRVHSALVGSGSGSKEESGTFLSSAVASGAAALLWERNKDESLGLEASDISALLMNHAVPDVRYEVSTTGQLAPVARQGAGRLDAWAAATAHTVVRSEQGLAELHFGYVSVTQTPEVITKRVTVRNFGDATATYAVAPRLQYPEDAGQGVSLEVDPARLEIPAGEARQVQVTMTIDPAGLRSWALYGHEAVLRPDLVSDLEVDGYIEVVEIDAGGSPVVDGDSVNVPFLVLPRRNSCIHSISDGTFFVGPNGGTFAQAWENPCDEPGWVDQYVLVAEDGEDPDTPAALDILSVGYRRFLQDPEDPESDLIMQWAIRTRGPRTTPESAQFRVLIDIDRDGVFDSVIYNLAAPEIGQYVEESFDQGRWLNAQTPPIEGTLEPDNFAIRAWTYQPYQLDETTTVLIASADEMGMDLRTGRESFDFGVMSVDVAGDYLVEGNFTGSDMVPNDLASGGRRSYAQEALDCLAFESRVYVDAHSTASTESAVYCLDVPIGEPISIMYDYVTNPPGSAAGDTRHGTYIERIEPAYLPNLMNKFIMP